MNAVWSAPNVIAPGHSPVARLAVAGWTGNGPI